MPKNTYPLWERRARCYLARTLYRQLGSYDKAAVAMKRSRERVRQLVDMADRTDRAIEAGRPVSRPSSYDIYRAYKNILKEHP